MALINLEELKTRLDEVPCKPRLFPTRLYALQILTGMKLDEVIDVKIVQPLSKVTEYEGPPFHYRFTIDTLKRSDVLPSNWVQQFIKDLAVYGLREAIGYFHTYEFLCDPSDLVDNAVAVYHDVAKLYLENVEKLENSNNESIKRMLSIVQLSGEGVPQDVKARYVPKITIGKRKEIPRHPDLEELHSWLGISKEPETYEEKLMEFIDCKFIFDGFPGFEDGVLQVAEILYEYGIDPKSKEGQNILKTFVEHALGEDELYGDFNRFTWCDNCHEEFTPEYSLHYANLILEQKILCPKCSKKEENRDV